MRLGYAHSISPSSLNLQTLALRAEGCSVLYVDHGSEEINPLERPELRKLFQSLRKGDEVVVWRYDVIGHRLSDYLRFDGMVESKKCSHSSLLQPLASVCAAGHLQRHMAIAQLEFEYNSVGELSERGYSLEYLAEYFDRKPERIVEMLHAVERVRTW